MIPAQTSTIVIYAGTNDVIVPAKPASTDVAGEVKAVQNAEPDLDALLASVQSAAPSARITLVTVRDLGRAGANLPGCTCAPIVLTAGAKEWNRYMRSEAARFGLTFLDLESDAAWYVRAEYDQYGIHPTDAGATRLAGALAGIFTH